MKHSLATSLRLLAIAALVAIPLISAPKASAANNATISISPGSQSVTKGSNVTFTVNVNPGTKDGGGSNEVRTWQAYINYPTSIFSGGTVTAATSQFNFPLEYSVSNGVISIVYSTFNGASAWTYSGPLVTVTLNAANAGSAPLTFASRCNDTPGETGCTSAKATATVNSQEVTTNVLGSTSGTTITVNNPATNTGGSGSTGGSTSGGSTSGGSGSTSKGGTSTSKGGTKVGTNSSSKPSTSSPAPSSNNPTTTPSTDTPQTTTETTSATDATVTLTLVDQDGKPVVGAKVTIDGASGTTDKNGKVTLSSVSPGALKGQVSYKGKTQSINLSVEDGSDQPKQTAKVTLKVEKSSSAAPIAITVGTLAVLGAAAFVLAGPGKGLGNLVSKLPGKGPKPPVAGSGPTAPTPPRAPTPPTPPSAPAQPSATNTQPTQATKPHSTLPKHVDPLAPGTTFTPTSGTQI